MDKTCNSYFVNYPFSFNPTENELLFNPNNLVHDSNNEAFLVNSNPHSIHQQYMKQSTDIDNVFFDGIHFPTTNYIERPVFPTNYDGTVNTNLLPVNRPIPINIKPEDLDLMMAGLKDYPCGKRGRPRKNKDEKPKEKIQKSSPSSASDKRKRGRPRKEETKFENENSNNNSDEMNFKPKLIKIEGCAEEIDLEDLALQILMEGKKKTRKPRKKTSELV